MQVNVLSRHINTESHKNKAKSVALVELPLVAVSRMSSCSQDKRLVVQLQAISKPAVLSLECFFFFFLGHV